MSDNCAIVCNAVEALVCGCNLDGGRICSAYSSCTSNRSTRKTEATYSEFTPYCYIVNSYKYDITKNSNDVKCSTYNADNTSEVFKCQGVRDIAVSNDVEYQYHRRSGIGDVYNSLTESESNNRYIGVDTSNDETHDISYNKTDVKINDLNEILRCLQAELSQRRSHTWYEGISTNITTITRESDISAIQKNSPIDIIANLRNLITQKNDFNGENPPTQFSRKSNTGEMIRVNDLKNIEKDLLNINTDCICYADCTNFLVRAKRSCTCNIDCVCNYR